MLLVAMAVAAVALADDGGYKAEAKGKGVEIVADGLPSSFAPGDFEATMTIRNVGELALRGALVVETVDGKGQNARQLGKAEIDMPPPSVSDVEVDLSAKGQITTAELGRTARVVLKIANKGDVVCLSAPVAEKAETVKKRKAEAAKATSSAGGRHDIRFADRLPDGEGEAYRAFLEAGGVLIVRLVASKDDYAGAAVFCGTNALPAFKPQKGPANPYDQNVAPGGTPLFDWPHRISPTLQAGNGRLSLPGEAGKKWETVQNGYTVLHRVGKGLLIVSTHTVADTKELREDIARQLKLEEDGLRFAGFSHDYGVLDKYKGRSQHVAIGGGKTVVKIKNVNFATTNLNLAARITITEKRKDGQSRTFLDRRKPNTKIGDVTTFELLVPPLDLNGRCTVKTEVFEWEGKKSWTIGEAEVDLPEFLEIVPPDFRATVSTKRQLPEVLIGLRVNRPGFNAAGAEWKLVAKDGKKAVVAEATGVFGKGETAVEAVLPVGRDAPAGTYALEAEMTLPCGAKFNASGEFFVVAPEKGQLMVDQNGFLLNEGEPYFPLGIYHMHTFNLNEPIDDTGLRARDMGFNWMQLWSWDWDNHLSLDRKVLDGFVGKDLVGAEREKAIDGLAETNRNTRALLKEHGVVIAFEGFGLWNDVIVERPGELGTFKFERDEGKIGPQIAAIADDPDALVRMWYLADEAGGNFHKELGRASALVRRHDKHLHPTFNLGNFESTTSGDYGGNDIYVRYYGGLGQAYSFAARVEEMRLQYAPLHRRPFVVPQAFGQSEKQATESPAWVRVEAYASVIHGASGIGFYCWKQTGDWSGAQKQGMGWNPPTAHEVKKLIEEIKVFQDALRVPGERILKSKDGNVHALLCGDDASGRFLIAANLMEGAVKTELPVAGLDDATLEPLFGAPAAKAKGGVLPLALPTWGTAAWRVK